MVLPVHLGVCILPTSRWVDARATWIDLEVAGVDHLWTYDHLSWSRMQGKDWFGSIPLLTAVAQETETALLGTLVASPNFRHPVPFAKDVMTLADISNGRFVCGIGAGGTSGDATVLGNEPWSLSERTKRFEEFADLLAELLTHEKTTHRGAYYSAVDAEMIPSVAVPLAVAATAPRAMAVAAKHADWWITYGEVRQAGQPASSDPFAAVASQVSLLEQACVGQGRSFTDLRRLLVVGFSDEPWMASREAFEDLAQRYADLGITDVVIHAPVPDSMFDHDPVVFEQILAANY